MSKAEILNLFPVEVFTIKASNHKKIKKYMMDNVYPHFEKKGANDPIQNTFTDYGFTHDAAFCHWPFLHNLYLPDIHNLLEKVGINFNDPWDIKLKCWYNFTTKNETEFVHDHMGGPTTIQFSAVHYVHLEDNDHPTAFKHPLAKMIKATMPSKNMDNIPSYWYDFERIPFVKEGDIIMFPSWLDHYVPKHTSGNLRVTNAINIMLRVDGEEGL